ncbi:MAG: hypothetical protein U9O90_02985, partial [Euryarchaeota archaeon]|nr:hypothetical protein [Euryarchaeota archaeon]
MNGNSNSNNNNTTTTGRVEEVGTYGEFRFRHPTVGDGDAIWSLVKRSPPLDLNSRYSYLVL